MSLAKDKPYYENPADYEDDVYAWAFEQAQLLRLKRFSEVDLPNLIEEIESLGRETRLQLELAYVDLIAYLLAWENDEQSRIDENKRLILNARFTIEQEEKDSRSLRMEAARIVEDMYPRAVRLATAATGLSRADFPSECPYDIEFLRSVDAMPSGPEKVSG